MKEHTIKRDNFHHFFSHLGRWVLYLHGWRCTLQIWLQSELFCFKAEIGNRWHMCQHWDMEGYVFRIDEVPLTCIWVILSHSHWVSFRQTICVITCYNKSLIFMMQIQVSSAVQGHTAFLASQTGWKDQRCCWPKTHWLTKWQKPQGCLFALPTDDHNNHNKHAF